MWRCLCWIQSDRYSNGVTPDAPSAELLRAYLRERDVACPGCRYNLRNLQSGNCPECGEPVVLQVAMAEPKQAACIAGLVALAAGVGFSGLLTIYFVFIIFARGMNVRSGVRLMSSTSGGLLVEGVVLLIWLANWRRIRRLTPVKRWMLVGGCILLTLINLLVFTLVVR